MSISLKKDPAKRLGGWALACLPAGTSGVTAVVVHRSDTGEYLGPHGWQGSQHAFGPFAVTEAAGGPAVRLGPEIVNRMEAYLQFRLVLPELALEETLSWPEDIVPAPNELKGGGVSSTMPPQRGDALRAGFAGKRDATPPSAAAAPPPPPEPVVAPLSSAPPPAAPSPVDLASVEPSPEPTPTETEGEKGKLPGWLIPAFAALALLIVVGGAAWWFLQDEVLVAAPEPPPVPDPVDEPVPEPVTLACVADDVTTILREPATEVVGLWSMAELCREAGDDGLKVRVLERLVSLEDPAALRQFALWYDPRGAGDARPFGEADAASAAQYYKRAAAAGLAEAEADLGTLCTYMRGGGGAMAQTLVAIHCE